MRLTLRGRRLVASAAIFLTLSIVGVSAGVASAVASAPTRVTETVVVQPGDTLWALAGSVFPEKDPREGVVMIRQMNPALISGELSIGQRLVIRR